MSTDANSETVFAALQERITEMQRHDEFAPPVAAYFGEKETHETQKLVGLATRQEYELSFTLICRYWANRVDHSDCRANAERVLADLLYRDVLAELGIITHAIYDGDRKVALQRISDLCARLRK